VDADEAVKGNSAYWSDSAEEYLLTYGDFLGPVEFRWCPEGLTEAKAGLLGPLEQLRDQLLLEIGAGAAQCSRWLAAQGVGVHATDVAPGMVDQAHRLNKTTGINVPLSVADARQLPFDSASFDQVFTAFGAVPFLKDLTELHKEVYRVLKPGGWWTFATTHPIRWAFPDHPEALTVNRSYFDRTPYAEVTGRGVYAEFHHTLGDHMQSLTSCGFSITTVVEPEWQEGNNHVWGGWAPTRGKLIPGTLIIQAQRSNQD